MKSWLMHDYRRCIANVTEHDSICLWGYNSKNKFLLDNCYVVRDLITIDRRVPHNLEVQSLSDAVGPTSKRIRHPRPKLGTRVRRTCLAARNLENADLD
jgi:hypothetical protein